jgi:hypothetical protein
MFEQTLREHAGERGNVKLHQIGQIAVEDAFERLAQRRMIAANRKNAERVARSNSANAWNCVALAAPQTSRKRLDLNLASTTYFG